jgi:hypothetical protein
MSSWIRQEPGHQRAVFGKDIAPAEAAAVSQDRAVLAEQQPVIRSEWPVKPQAVRGDGGGEGRVRVALGNSVERGAPPCR